MSFDPYAAPSDDRGSRNRRSDNSYDDNDYEDNNRSSRSGESRFRTVPLVLTIIFALIAIVAIVMTFDVTGATATGDAATIKGWAAMAGFVAFGLFIVTVRKVVRKRN